MSSVRIAFASLWMHRGSSTGGAKREPVSRLGERGDGEHIHGTLVIEIAGRAVPYLGFFGPNDVCLNAWLVQLCNAVNTLDGTVGEYTFDEGEQGQPAFVFIRLGDAAALSINESPFGGGAADPEWQDVSFSYQDFRAAVLLLLDELRAELRQQAPRTWERWWPREAHIT